MPGGRILIVEDRDSLRKLLARALRQEEYEVATASDAQAALQQIRAGSFDLVLTDLKLPDASGIDVLRASRESQPATPVVVLTAFGTVAKAVEAMKLGATDFLEKPVELDDLYGLVAGLIGQDPKATSFAVPGGPEIVGRHPRFRAALRLLQRVAPTETTVLLTGESGTGKELFAGALHALSPRSQGPFVALNCAAIPESLLENELFGHERGAFTGASRRQAGRFELAGGGTLLLDEIGELNRALQGKVLRVLEERTFERVGGGATLRADVRMVAATNRDLQEMVSEGEFRSDLYYRLDVFPIELPALRHRASDVPILARHLLAQRAERHQVGALHLTAEATQFLAAQSWPGNVRQLSNVIERATILAQGPALEASDFRALLQGTLAADDRARLRQALVATNGDKKKAAELLRLSYSTLCRRVKEQDLEGFPKYRD